MIKIMTDLAADVPKDVAEKLGIAVLPFYINAGGAKHTCGRGLHAADVL